MGAAVTFVPSEKKAYCLKLRVGDWPVAPPGKAVKMSSFIGEEAAGRKSRKI